MCRSSAILERSCVYVCVCVCVCLGGCVCCTRGHRGRAGGHPRPSPGASHAHSHRRTHTHSPGEARTTRSAPVSRDSCALELCDHTHSLSFFCLGARGAVRAAAAGHPDRVHAQLRPVLPSLDAQSVRLPNLDCDFPKFELKIPRSV